MAVTVPFRWAVVGSVAAGVLCAGGVTLARAQVDRRDIPIVTQPQQQFDSGQDVQPIFEGWERNDDGSLTFHFGYLNRNYREQPSIQIGPNNHFSPGESNPTAGNRRTSIRGRIGIRGAGRARTNNG